MINRLAMTDAQREAHDAWLALDVEDVGWNLRRQFQVPEHVAAAIVGKITSVQQFCRVQEIMLEDHKRRIAWLETKVDPEVLRPASRDAVSCKPPADASD